MIAVIQQNPLVTSFLPSELIAELEKPEMEEAKRDKQEDKLFATAKLIANIVLGTIDVLKSNCYKGLDGNAADGGCQSRALELRRLVKMDLEKECSPLNEEAKKIKAMVIKRKGNLEERSSVAPHLFFTRFLKPITVSKEMEYILHSYLSAFLRRPYEYRPSGVVMTRSDPNRLTALAEDKKNYLEGDIRKKIVEENQKKLSFLSVKAMHGLALEANFIDVEEKKLMVKMLSKEHTHCYSKDKKKFEPKFFGCFFYVIKAVSCHLRQNQEIVCLKSIVPKDKGKPFYILMQSQSPEKDLTILPDALLSSLPDKSPVIVFEAVIKGEKKEAISHLMKFGFTSSILSQAAITPPYEEGSTLEDVKDPKAVKEIMSYIEKHKEMGDMIEIDHVYLTTIGEERK